MRTVLTRIAAVALTGALAVSARAADVRPAAAPAGPEVHKMVILNGRTLTANYFGAGLSTSDQAALRDLESAENNADYAADLQALRRQYVSQELTLVPGRAVAQQGLYGQSITRAADYQYGGSYGPGYYPGLGYLNAGYNSGVFGYGNYGYGPGFSSFATTATTINQSLANGVGDEGALKTAMAPVIAAQANPEFGASAARTYTAALNRAGDSESLRTALGMNPHGVVTAAAEQPRHVVLTLKQGAGDKVDGNLVDEDSEWFTVATPAGDVSVRRADVARIERLKK